MRLKATLFSAVLLGMFASSIPSFAEVQNVRVGGDVTVRAFHRENMDLNEDDDAATGVGDSTDDFFMATTGINIGADLTENVSAFVRLVNERDWNAEGAGGGVSQDTDDIGLSQAYVTLNEMFYSPLTLRVGTQPIVWGRGFVLGSNFIPSVLGNANDRNAAIAANEYTDYTAFDAVRATLDLSNLGGMTLPLTADYVYIKLDENSVGVSDDVNLQGINLSTQFDSSEFETYYLHKRDTTGGTDRTDVHGSLSTLGLRGSGQPVENSLIFGELAYQWGKRATDAEGVYTIGSGQQAWAMNLGAEYTLQDVVSTPTLGTEWIFWSGNDCSHQVTTTGPTACGGWDPIARGYFTTAIREFQSNAATGFYPTPQVGDTAGATNQHQFAVYGSFVPLEDLNVSSRLTLFVLDVPTIQGVSSGGGQNERRRYAGSEWDTNFVYNYTEDVSLGLLYALFVPGTVYETANDSTAQQLVSTVSIKF